MLMIDNATVVAYLRKQGEIKSMPLCLLAREVLFLIHGWEPIKDMQMLLQVKHIPGERNALADLLSKKNKVVHMEWMLLQSVADTLFLAWGKPNVDLFATRLNNRLPMWISPLADPQALGIDAMSWKGMYAYAFPHLCYLGE